jgi:hypothetical protein
MYSLRSTILWTAVAAQPRQSQFMLQAVCGWQCAAAVVWMWCVRHVGLRHLAASCPLTTVSNTTIA